MNEFDDDFARIGESLLQLKSHIFGVVTSAEFQAALAQFADSVDQVQWVLFAQAMDVEQEGRYWSEEKRVLFMTGRFSPEQIDEISNDNIPMLTQLSSLLPDRLLPLIDSVIDLSGDIESAKGEDQRRSREDLQRKRREMRRGKK